VAFLGDRASYYCDPVLAKQLRWAPPVMGAELIATLQGYSKAELDNLSLQSHLKAQSAWDKGYYGASVIPISHDSGAVALARDELIRGNLNIDKLASMAPAFSQQGAAGFDAMMLAAFPQLDAIDHVHSIANCPGMADGAALVVVGDRTSGARAGLNPKARILAMAETAGDPILQLTAGLDAVDEVLRKTHLSIKDFDRIEFMEAFAAPTLKFLQDYQPDIDKVNVNGGHIAMGHPMGASGAILLATLVHELHRCDGSLGLVVTQAAGGIGCAMIIERL
jgi:acetyl-CoA acetyltransferase family protein